tara:strand:+ start:130 stop:891 length:762 start_codon:yes stop_codon:yes gene_type:complete
MTHKDLLDFAQEKVCLSLKECSERRNKFKDRWKNFLPEDSYRFHIAERPTEESLNNRFGNFSGAKLGYEKLSATDLGRWGCWLSHYDIISNCKSRGVKSVLILEDDTYPNLEIIDKQINEVPYDWDIIYLGHSSFDLLAKYESEPLVTERTFLDETSKHRFGGWKKIRAWGTYGMIVRNTVFDKYINELKDYVFEKGHITNVPTADGTYFFYLWKNLSFYFEDHLVLHDYSLMSEITKQQALRKDYIDKRSSV